MGGIQNYLWELWRRLPPDRVTVLTTPHVGDREFDAAQPFRVVRTREPVLLPTPSLARRIRALADEVGAELVLFDPAWLVGLLGPKLGRRYGVVLHGAEVTVPGRLPVSRRIIGRVLRGSSLVVAADGYVLEEAQRAAGRSLHSVVVRGGVDVGRFRPLDGDVRTVRETHGLPPHGPLVVGVSRLVPRKGFDVLIAAASLLTRDFPELVVAIAGRGRDDARLARLAETTHAPVRFLGRVDDADLPGLVASADVFAMPCRGSRWCGLEQEGFGIVFVEAAACGVPQVAGDSGGAAEAVAHGETGFVVRWPDDPWPVADAIAALLADAATRAAMGAAARRRAEDEFDYDRLAVTLDAALKAVE